MPHATEIKDLLKDCILKIKSNYPSLSSSQLAKKIDVSISTFSRIENADTTKPDFNNAFKVIRAAHPNEKFQTVLKSYYPEIWSFFSNITPGNTDAEFIDSKTEAYFTDPNTYEIMVMASTQNGVTKEFIKKEFGDRGVNILSNLLKEKILINNGENYSLGIKKINASQEVVQTLVSNLIKNNYKVENYATQKNRLTLQYESVNAEKVIPKIVKILENAFADVKTEFANPENFGKDVVWVGMSADTLGTNAEKNTIDLNTNNDSGKLQ